MMIRRITYRITTADTKDIQSTEKTVLNIASYLRRHGCTGHQLSLLKKTEDAILLNGHPTSNTGTLLQPGDQLILNITEPSSSTNIVPYPVPFEIVYEDEDILVVNKGPGIPIHPSQGNHENTLANGLAWYYARKGEPFTFHCINRLDRDTSGLVLLARHSFAAGILSRSMQKRQIHRTYRALVLGHTKPEGTIDLPIARKDGSIIEREVNSITGAAAMTHYRTIDHWLAKAPALNISESLDREDASSFPCSLIELHLDTGRTHQIRVHMCHIGHPLLGDHLYHPTDPSGLQRQALHSYSLEFPHPIHGNICRYQVPMPEDLRLIEK